MEAEILRLVFEFALLQNLKPKSGKRVDMSVHAKHNRNIKATLPFKITTTTMTNRSPTSTDNHIFFVLTAIEPTSLILPMHEVTW